MLKNGNKCQIKTEKLMQNEEMKQEEEVENAF
jgi:hypothetical protein